MPYLLIAVLLGAVVWLWIAVRERGDELDQLNSRLTVVEVRLDQLKSEQDQLAAEWSGIFQSQVASWDAHIDRITEDATLKLALRSNHRGRVRR